MLPEIDGLEVCKLLRRDAATAKIPILMLTAKAARVTRVLGLEIGADDYVTKPFSPRELVLRIKKFSIAVRRKWRLANDALRRSPRLISRSTGRHGRANRFDLTATEFKLLTILA